MLRMCISCSPPPLFIGLHLNDLTLRGLPGFSAGKIIKALDLVFTGEASFESEIS